MEYWTKLIGGYHQCFSTPRPVFIDIGLVLALTLAAQQYQEQELLVVGMVHVCVVPGWNMEA